MKKFLFASLFLVTHATANEINFEEKVVLVKANEYKFLDMPGSVNIINEAEINKSPLKTNLSEFLSTTPGVLAADRGGYSRDIVLSVRGFGARSQTAGIRGQQIYVDGIPYTLPDGQTSSQNIPLSLANRIEIIKGPLATLYGNASGAVIQIYTKTPKDSSINLETLTGSWGQHKNNLMLSGSNGRSAYLIDYTDFQSRGFRDNSSVERKHFNANLVHQINQDVKIKLNANVLDEPYAYDPRPLSLIDALNNPTKSNSPTRDRLRKITQQNQFGQTLEYILNSTNNISISTYFGDRQVRQFSTPSTAVSPARYIDSARDYSGFNFTFNNQSQIFSRPLNTSISFLNAGSTEMYLQGRAENGEAVDGIVLRRDKRSMTSNSFVAQTNYSLTDTLNVLGGIRQTQVKIGSVDQTAMSNNSSIDYSNLGYVVGLTNYLNSSTNLYLNYGVGFETPTFTELTYTRAGNTNSNTFNSNLREAKNTQFELGLKSYLSAYSYFDLVAFNIKTNNEIAVDLSQGGSIISYKNIPSGTTRRGLELSYLLQPYEKIRLKATGTLIDAVFDEASVSGTNLIAAGNKVPGVPSKAYTLSATYSATNFMNSKVTSRSLGWLIGYDYIYMGDYFTSDSNDLKAPSYQVQNIMTSYNWSFSGFELGLFARLNNLENKRYIGSIQVANPTPFEPGAPRNWLVGARLNYQLR